MMMYYLLSVVLYKLVIYKLNKLFSSSIKCLLDDYNLNKNNRCLIYKKI